MLFYASHLLLFLKLLTFYFMTFLFNWIVKNIYFWTVHYGHQRQKIGMGAPIIILVFRVPGNLFRQFPLMTHKLHVLHWSCDIGWRHDIQHIELTCNTVSITFCMKFHFAECLDFFCYAECRGSPGHSA